MKITYVPEIINGEQAQGDSIIKYDQEFTKGQTRDITDATLAAKLLTAPYFFEGEGNIIPAPKKASPKKKAKKPVTIDV